MSQSNCHKCMINVSFHTSAAAVRYKFIPFKFSAARASRLCRVPGCAGRRDCGRDGIPSFK